MWRKWVSANSRGNIPCLDPWKEVTPLLINDHWSHKMKEVVMVFKKRVITDGILTIVSLHEKPSVVWFYVIRVLKKFIMYVHSFLESSLLTLLSYMICLAFTIIVYELTCCKLKNNNATLTGGFFILVNNMASLCFLHELPTIVIFCV